MLKTQSFKSAWKKSYFLFFFVYHIPLEETQNLSSEIKAALKLYVYASV